MKTPVTQRSSPCYSAVSALLMNPLPDHSNYSPLCHTHYLTLDQYFIVSSGQTLYQATSWRLILQISLLQRFTAESSRGTQCFEEAEQQAEASVDVSLEILNSFPFCLFSFYLYPLLYSLYQSSLFSLSPIPSFSSDQFFVLIKTSSFITFCFTNGTFFCILFHTMTHFF